MLTDRILADIARDYEPEPVVLYPDIEDCDWEEARCPVCNHDLVKHSASELGRCANAAL